ncbi:hypothetical protein BJ742DRAFT_745608 [Cladochytrium replicatum]|nr:hypothetical protein BJ742DRAFT_745608 [Cladochytrium replicatum]
MAPTLAHQIYRFGIHLAYSAYLALWYTIFYLRLYRDGDDSAAWFQVTETRGAQALVESGRKLISRPRTNGAVRRGHVQMHTEGLLKKPERVGVIVGEKASAKDVGRFVVWAGWAGIKYLDIFDTDGLVKEKRNLVEMVVETYSDSEVVRMVESNDYGSVQEQMSGCDRVVVRFLAKKDWTDQIAAAANDSASSGVVDQKKLEDNLNSGLTQYLDPEAHLIYIFGGEPGMLKLNGYSPWGIRLSEFCSIPGDGRIRYGGFLKGLYQFAHTDQRFGK